MSTETAPHALRETHRLAAVDSSSQSSVGNTMVDESTLPTKTEDAEAIAAAGAPAGERVVGAEHKLSQGRKWFLLFIFSVAQYLDICSYSGVFLLIPRIQEDLKIRYETSTWILTAYTVTFCAALPIWGRVADLYSAKPVFVVGFLGVSLFNLIISFVTDQYAYYIMRALSGVFASATIPSAFRLIPAIFEAGELPVALQLFGLSGAVANLTGLIIAGAFGAIKFHNQNADWRWFFRFIAILIVPFAIASMSLIPHTKGARADETSSQKEKIKRLDLGGGLIIFFAIVLLILGLTLGASWGFKTAKFLVPFLLSWPLFVAFFIWEAKVPIEVALIPPAFWKTKNIILLSFLALSPYAIWAFALIGLLQRWVVTNNQSPIIAAVRYLPAAVSGILLSTAIPILLPKYSARWFLAIGYFMAGFGYVLFVFSKGQVGVDYWKYEFTGLVIGLGPGIVSFLAINISYMTCVTPEVSGVAGGVLQVCIQLGAVLAVSIQAGILTVQPGGIGNFYNIQVSYWFVAGWSWLFALAGLFLWRDPKSVDPTDAGAVENGTKKGEKDENMGKTENSGQNGCGQANTIERHPHESLQERRIMEGEGVATNI